MKTIHSYISSDGSVRHLLVNEVGHEGYLELVRQSLVEIARAKIGTDNPDELRALQELEESYRKTLNGEQPARNWTKEPDVEYLSHCVMIAYSPVLDVQVPEKNYRSEVTRFKAEWRKKLPIRSYLGALKLSPDKHEGVTEGMDNTIEWTYA